MVLDVEPSGATDRSKLGLLGGVLRARSQQRSCGPALGPEAHVNSADRAVAHFHKAQTGAVVRPGPGAPDTGSDLLGDGPGGRLGEDTGLGDPGLGTVTERVDAPACIWLTSLRGVQLDAAATWHSRIGAVISNPSSTPSGKNLSPPGVTRACQAWACSSRGRALSAAGWPKDQVCEVRDFSSGLSARTAPTTNTAVAR